jgi:hypothetical protein
MKQNPEWTVVVRPHLEMPGIKRSVDDQNYDQDEDAAQTSILAQAH